MQILNSIALISILFFEMPLLISVVVTAEGSVLRLSIGELDALSYLHNSPVLFTVHLRILFWSSPFLGSLYAAILSEKVPSIQG